MIIAPPRYTEVDTVGKGQLVLRGDVTLTPEYTEGADVSSAIMADLTKRLRTAVHITGL